MSVSLRACRGGPDGADPEAGEHDTYIQKVVIEILKRLQGIYFISPK